MKKMHARTLNFKFLSKQKGEKAFNAEMFKIHAIEIL